jgi:TPR repeat protein
MRRHSLLLLPLLLATSLGCAEDVKPLARASGVEINVLSDFESGSRRAVAGDYKMAKILFEQGAKKGDRRCMFALGTTYYFGEGVKKDLKEALKWLEMAQSKGDSPSAFMLSVMHGKGEVTNPDPARQMELLRIAARGCVPQAQNELSARLYEGEGLPQNRLESIAWLAIAADAETDDAGKTRALLQDIRAELSEADRAALMKIESGHRATLKCDYEQPQVE